MRLHQVLKLNLDWGMVGVDGRSVDADSGFVAADSRLDWKWKWWVGGWLELEMVY